MIGSVYPQLRVLSLGWGVQSFTVAAMVALGDLPPIDVAIHADTTHEMQHTYEFAARWAPWLAQRGVPVMTEISRAAQTVKEVSSCYTDIPAFTLSSCGKRGQLRRQCTREWKIRAIRDCLRRFRGKRQVLQLLGISLDESRRMRSSDVRYIINDYPLITACMTRADCVAYLERHGLEIPGRSSCTFCPYHSKREWAALRQGGGSDWAEAVAVDAALRNVRPPFDLFIHPARIPLVDVDLSY